MFYHWKHMSVSSLFNVVVERNNKQKYLLIEYAISHFHRFIIKDFLFTLIVVVPVSSMIDYPCILYNWQFLDLCICPKIIKYELSVMGRQTDPNYRKASLLQNFILADI